MAGSYFRLRHRRVTMTMPRHIYCLCNDDSGRVRSGLSLAFRRYYSFLQHVVIFCLFCLFCCDTQCGVTLNIVHVWPVWPPPYQDPIQPGESSSSCVMSPSSGGGIKFDSDYDCQKLALLLIDCFGMLPKNSLD